MEVVATSYGFRSMFYMLSDNLAVRTGSRRVSGVASTIEKLRDISFIRAPTECIKSSRGF